MSSSWLGIAAFVLLAGSMVLWFQRIRQVRIPRDRRGFVACWVLAAGLGVFALAGDPGWLGGVPAGLAAVGGLLFTTLFVISPQRVAADAIQVGDRLRDFEALDEHGQTFSLASAAGTPLLLKFFRGHW